MVARNSLPRGFRISDGLILIAGLAAGLTALRFYVPAAYAMEIFNSASILGLPYRFLLFAIAIIPVPAALTIAIMVARVVPPRPSCRRIACQPGASACLSVSFGIAISFIGSLPLDAIQAYELTNHANNYLENMIVFS